MENSPRRSFSSFPLILAVLAFLACLISFKPAAGFPEDTSKVTLRMPTGIEEYKQQKEFQYDRVISRRPGFLQRFLEWIYSKLDLSMKNETKSMLLFTLRWIFIISAIIFILVILFKGEIRNLFYRNRNFSRIAGVYEDVAKDSEEIEKAILDALKNKDYSLAIRWNYIKAIKLLTEKGHITFKQDKTNHDYIMELKDRSMMKAFERLTYYFEYSNYGDFKVEEPVYTDAVDAYRILARGIS